MDAVALVLASNSPRRHEMLGWTGWGFRKTSAAIDESTLPAEEPSLYVSRLAEGKARSVTSHQFQEGELILAADTIVADGSVLLGKPEDADQARWMLRRLRGRVHQVYTSIVLLEPISDRFVTDLCVAEVPMRTYSDAEADAYIASGDPLDKAGAYAIQHAGFHPVEKFSGCFACVMGLPLCHVTRSLFKMGVKVTIDVPSICQHHLNYSCPIWHSVLENKDV
jgi:septum formation protein